MHAPTSSVASPNQRVCPGSCKKGLRCCPKQHAEEKKLKGRQVREVNFKRRKTISRGRCRTEIFPSGVGTLSQMQMPEVLNKTHPPPRPQHTHA